MLRANHSDRSATSPIQHPQQSLGDRLIDHILLYRHDFRSVNILELVQSAEEVSEGCLLEIVISRMFYN